MKVVEYDSSCPFQSSPVYGIEFQCRVRVTLFSLETTKSKAERKEEELIDKVSGFTTKRYQKRGNENVRGLVVVT